MDGRYRAGIDIGGTFTDLVLIDDATGEQAVGKILTSPEDPSEAVEEGLVELLERENVAAAQLRTIIHGTTLVNNALIERKGARTALLTTQGFRDAVAIGTEHRYDMYDVLLEKPEPLVERGLRYGVRERTLDDGSVALELDEGQVRSISAELRKRGIEAVAICFLHAFRNPAHERRVAEILADEAPKITVSLSSEVPADTLEPGDVLVTNHPWQTAGHLNDFTVITPIFGDGDLVASFGNCCHTLDVGGRSLGADARQVYEQGLFVPVTRLFGCGEPFTYVFFSGGGMGARPNGDGLSATAFPSGIRGVPAEVIESISPVIMHRRELRPDSEGPGRHRGGFGQEMEIGVRSRSPWTLSAMYDRTRCPAQGVNGGSPGGAGAVRTASGEDLHPKRQQRLKAGERVILSLPGGGSFGVATEREPERVARDVSEGLVSAERAREIYRVVLTGADGHYAVDEEATDRLRAGTDPEASGP